MLVRRAKAGDIKAFTSLYEIYVNAIYRYIYYRIDHIEQAQNLTEQVFLTAWETLSGYQDRGNPFSSWLYWIAQNIVANHQRLKNENAIIDHPSPFQQVKHKNSLLRQIIETQDTETLAHAIAKLPHEQQEVIILKLIEGLNHGEVSQLLSKDQKSCRILQHRALLALNDLLEIA
jgi:RNA polymerase sigma-70 factor (ECF subfamily)